MCCKLDLKIITADSLDLYEHDLYDAAVRSDSLIGIGYISVDDSKLLKTISPQFIGAQT
jgi:hypothetical protein